jgi:uncharacterized protein (DUF433 family)
MSVCFIGREFTCPKSKMAKLSPGSSAHLQEYAFYPNLTTVNMSALEAAEELLAKLSPAEKAQVLQWAARDVGGAFPGIESRPGVCGGEPCIVRTRIPVWVLEQARRLGTAEAELLRIYPTLRAEDLANAWAYVRSHRKEILEQIEANEAD